MRLSDRAKSLRSGNEAKCAALKKDEEVSNLVAWENEPDLAALRRAYDLIGRDGPSAIDDLQRLARRGSLMSMVYLGNIYRRGEADVPPDLTTAECWFRRAADKGSLVALFHLSILYLNQKRYPEAEAALTDGSRRDYAPSAYWLARLYWHGPLDRRRPAEVVALLERAANAGHIWANRDLGIGYLRGSFGLRPFRGLILLLRGAMAFLREFQSDPKSQRLRRDGAWNE